MVSPWRNFGMVYSLVLYAVFLTIGIAQDRDALIYAAVVAAWQIAVAVMFGWRPWPRTGEGAAHGTD